MKAASAKDIKEALQNLPESELLALCLRLSRFKKENKELLTYLLFEAADEESYVQELKSFIELEFEALPEKSAYLAKKSIRRIIRSVNRYLKYTDVKTTSVEVMISLCRQLRRLAKIYRESVAIQKIYSSHLKKVETIISTLHEDLQFDYKKELEDLI